MKIGFFVSSDWAFGSIHDALCKELYKKGIYAHIIDWETQYSYKEFAAFSKLFDLFCTIPGGSVPILHDYGIPNERIVAVAHGRFDVQCGLESQNEFGKFHTWAGVSPDLVDYSAKLGIDAPMKVAKNGIHFDNFYAPASTSLKRIGYGGALEFKNRHNGNRDLKRGWLVKRVSEGLNIPVHLVTRRHYLGMPAYYREVDCVMVSSTEESCGLPLMEGAAAGRLPISTPVGVARDYENAPGVVLPFDEGSYLTAAIREMHRLSIASDEFHRKCVEAQEFARANYDWSVRIDDWVKLFTE